MAADNGVGPRIADGTGAGSYYLQKFRLYETRSQFYMFGRNKSRTVWRVLKIDRLDPFELNISEDSTTYTQRECSELMNRIHEGNKSTGGLKFVTSCYGIAGFIKFLGPYYMLLITQRRPIGAICGHIVYAVTKSDMFVIPNFSVLPNMVDMRSENRYKKLLSAVDLTKDFFFSYSYHIMRSLQNNLSHHESGQVLYETLFVWNEFLTRGIRNHLKNTLWTVALIHGFFKQDKLSISGKNFRLTLIARRSRHYAGTRYLKRGVNEMGRVANDVETEQIVFEDIPGEIPTQITSVVQNRGSIPLFWSQETSRLNIRPDIILHKKDKTYQATRLHFENLGKRYGNPIIILNLIKSHEKKPRESILRAEFAYAIDFINKNLSEDDRLKFLHWDLNKYSRSKTINVLWSLGKVAAYALNLTGFFYCQVTPVISLEGALKWPVLQKDNVNDYTCKNQIEINRKDDVDVGVNGSQNGNMTNSDASRQDNSKVNNGNAGNCLVKQPLFQKGVLRTNCIDCLDRTNVAQYAYGLAALGHQLHVLGFIDIPKIDRDAPLADELMSFYERMGDTLALQYGGSAAHNKIFSERRGQWKAATQSQEFFRTLQRYYSNAYMDAEKQDAINLFLGHFEPQQGKPALWDLSTDEHDNVERHVHGFVDENERSFIKRSVSVGNVLHGSNSSVSLSNVGHMKHSDSAMADRTHKVGNAMGLSESTPEISTCEIDVAYSRYTSMMDRQERFAESEHICFNDHGIDSSNCSNFLDLDWLSSSGNSYEEEIFERSTHTSTPAENLSTENVINGLTIERTAPHIKEGESSVKGKEIAAIQSSQELEFLSKFPESFVHWVTHGEALFH